MKKTVCGACVSSLIVALSMPAQAERADREKPIHLEADRMSIDDVKKVKILEGNAVLIQGTMELRTSRLSYDALNEKYLATTGGGTVKSATGAAQARVRAIIQPKSKDEKPAEKKGDPLNLKPAPKVNPRVD
jgi:lipopolysaccharide export system protein LptA